MFLFVQFLDNSRYKKHQRISSTHVSYSESFIRENEISNSYMSVSYWLELSVLAGIIDPLLLRNRRLRKGWRTKSDLTFM